MSAAGARLLLVGFGRRGREWHATAASRGDCAIAGVVDSDGGALAAARSDGLRTWSSLDAALAAADATAAVVATPPALHVPHAFACLEAGLRVLVEKPLALSLQEAEAVTEAAEAAGQPVVVGHNFRHRRPEQALRRALERGVIGELRAVTVFTARPRPAPADEPPQHAPLWDLGVHHLDLLRGRLDGPPDTIDARSWQGAHGDTYQLHLEWDGRATAEYSLREGTSVYHHAEWLEGPDGALRSLDGRVSLVTRRRRPRRLRPPRVPPAREVLLHALLSGDTGSVDAREALGTIAMVEAATSSLTLQRPVRLARLPALRNGAPA